MNQTPSTSDPWQSNFTPHVKQEVEDSQGSLQQQAAVGSNNDQAQNVNDEGEKSSDRNLHDGVFAPVPVVGQQAASGNHNNQNQNTISIVNHIRSEGFVFSDEKASKSDKNHTLSDPTKPLPQKPKNLPEVKIDELSDYCRKLREDSLIIVTCSDLSAAFAVAYGLTEHVSVSSRRLFTGEWGTLKKLTIEPSIDIVFNSEIGDGKPTLIVIDTYEMQTFLDSLVVQSTTAALIKQDLRDREIFCICLAESQALKTTLERKSIKLSFPQWEIPFEQEGASREQQNIRGGSISGYEDGQAAISLYETADILGKTVLYTATFFQNLNIGDFERVVTLLIADQTTPIIEPESRTEVPTNSPESTVSVTVGGQVVTFNQSQKGQVYQEQVNGLSQSQTQKRRLLCEIWEEDAEQILQSCHLRLALNEYGARVIDFSMLHLRGELREYFQNVKFVEYRNKFRKLVELNLLFDESSQITKALRDLSVSMMIFQPGTEFWVNWLEQSTISALERSVNKKNSDLIYYCVADLLRETLDYSQLEDLTEIFLERMVSSKQHDVVLSLSRRLRFSPQFDEYYWFKQSIDRGSEDTRRQAYRLLYNQLKQSNSRVYETLEKIHSWVPDLETDPAKYSPSNKYALQVLLEYLIETLEQFDPKLYGEEVFSYPLFGGLRSGESIDRRLKMVIEWLLHPGVDSIIDEVDSLSIISILVFPGLFTILLGLKEDISVKFEFSSIVDSLFISINDVIEAYEKKINKEYRTSIVAYWRILSNIYLKASNHEIESGNWNEGNFLNYKRNIIDYLIEKIDP
jgi:hypothetical protein